MKGEYRLIHVYYVQFLVCYLSKCQRYDIQHRIFGCYPPFVSYLAPAPKFLQNWDFRVEVTRIRLQMLARCRFDVALFFYASLHARNTSTLV